MGQSDFKRVELEIDICMRLTHPGLVQCYGTSEQVSMQGALDKLWIVMECCDHGTLDDMLHTKKYTGGQLAGTKYNIKPPRMLQWMREIASGMGFLHERDVCHRDLKAANVLIDRHKSCRMCDYGVSKLMGSQSLSNEGSSGVSSSGQIGTWDYMPPEALLGEPSGAALASDEKATALDIYSFGVLLNEMASGARPWSQIPKSNPARSFVIQNLVTEKNERPILAAGISPDFRKLIDECWATNPMDRPQFDGPGGIIARLEEIGNYTSAPSGIEMLASG